MRTFIALAAFAALIGQAGTASAQAPRGAYGQPAYGSQPATSRDPRSPERGNPSYTQPPGQTGIIRWNTPNADGNLGSPSLGGGPGSP